MSDQDKFEDFLNKVEYYGNMIKKLAIYGFVIGFVLLILYSCMADPEPDLQDINEKRAEEGKPPLGYDSWDEYIRDRTCGGDGCN